MLASNNNLAFWHQKHLFFIASIEGWALSATFHEDDAYFHKWHNLHWLWELKKNTFEEKTNS